MEYDRKFDNLLVGTPVTGSYTHGVRVYKGVIAQVQHEDPHRPPYYVKLYKEYSEKNLWFYPWEIQSIDSPRAGEKPHLRPERIPAGYRINPDTGELERIPRPPRVNDPRPPRVRKLRNVDNLWGEIREIAARPDVPVEDAIVAIVAQLPNDDEPEEREDYDDEPPDPDVDDEAPDDDDEVEEFFHTFNALYDDDIDDGGEDDDA